MFASTISCDFATGAKLCVIIQFNYVNYRFKAQVNEQKRKI